jgi:hypothetical protein
LLITAPNHNSVGRPGAAVGCGFFDGQRLCGAKHQPGKTLIRQNINQTKRAGM